MSPTDDGVNPVRWAISHYVFRNGASSRSTAQDDATGPSKWSMGILNDKETVEVPGSVLLLAKDRNEPLGLRNIHARTSHSSIPTGFPVEPPPAPPAKKKTEDGTIILDPQPDDSVNDPLNWPSWRRDAALLSLGFYCMIGGGITPLIAAGFTDVARDFDVSVERVALTTGLCMTGLGIGSVIASPTAILYGKRPIYLTGAILFIATSLWAGFSPSFESLLAARVFQGISISPVECLPSATIAEIFFLHERAYRIGIYTLLLLGGKNLIPLVSAAIIGRFGWRWAFYIVSMVVGLGFVLLFLFVPETFWDRTPTRRPTRKPSLLRRLSSRHTQSQQPAVPVIDACGSGEISLLPNEAQPDKNSHDDISASTHPKQQWGEQSDAIQQTRGDPEAVLEEHRIEHKPSHVGFAESQDEKDSRSPGIGGDRANIQPLFTPSHDPATSNDPEKNPAPVSGNPNAYTHDLRQRPAQSFTQHLKPFHGRLNHDNWFKVMLRPFILLAYPAVLWSAIIYSCSIGWLIVLSETIAMIYRNPEGYNFTALQTGLVYVSPFIGAILGTGVAGKISDILVRAMSRRNGGMYEPEFRLIMAAPILITTSIGLMGFGWSAEEKDSWIVPTVFFGIVSFGCSLGSTTSITFCVDSYRQYAGEALVTLNFTKNIAHGLVFSLFVSHWLEKDGSKMVYIWIGVIQCIVCLLSIPMYIYGKRARMWTARKNFMEKF
ncbi:hypothetical protein FDECE_8417 [Fusarium decemcellulare]|nr:hypothetical protein FDECE_8417 [Fusarium decemcellulare]